MGWFLVALEYRMLAKKGEGTFSEVLKAQCIKTNKYVAIKCMKSNFDNIEQVQKPSRILFSNFDIRCTCFVSMRKETNSLMVMGDEHM
jgi:serine/threonine protein kinase